ncbi:MAG: hypothetical protein M3N39_14075 [Pseudomonadota bacterium]|nr:hypothetical protein [Pseudomonadota bacterium]
MLARSVLAGTMTLMLAAAPAAAQTIATSRGPEQVGVTVYRAPFRASTERLNLAWLNGFALITETRRVSLPAGEADLRFEGVAGGILPESAIVTGLPSGVVEKNQDAYLLSPASLIDASLGKRVNLRRTSRATGQVREVEAVVRSSSQGGVVLETEAGVEALRCTGLAETVTYDRVPPGLSAKPTLSVRVRSDRPAEATVTLSYLATGFDWQANYVAELSPDGKRMDLFAWLTLANSDETGFRNASTNAVAGRLNRSSGRATRPRAQPLRLECWPAGTTSDVPAIETVNSEEIIVTGARMSLSGPPPPPPPPPPPMAAPAMLAQQEELGDLKLYRIPEPVTVAAKSQKQVAFIDRDGVKVDTLYRQRLYASDMSPRPVMRVVVTRNRSTEGLGLPLPAGRVVIFAQGRERPVLIGLGSLQDKSVGENVDIEIGTASAVTAQLVNLTPESRGSTSWELTVTNPHPQSIRYEAEFETGAARFTPNGQLGRRDGRPLWTTTIPANGSARLRYTLAPQ